jgi:hypothetical protein
MKSFFGVLFVLSIFFAVVNPAELTWWQRVLPVPLVLALQVVVVGKGLERVTCLQSQLDSVNPEYPQVRGSCRWEVFADDSWTITIQLSGLPERLAFADGVTEFGAGMELNVKGESVQPKWVRRKNHSPQTEDLLYDMTATLDHTQKVPSAFREVGNGEVVAICHNAQPVLEGTLATN